MNFKELDLPAPLLATLQAKAYHTPTPVQQAAIPALLKGNSAKIHAETGSGKTAAFLLPILANSFFKENTIRALILSPTRELAVQIQKEARNLAMHLPQLKISAYYGGHAFDAERKSLVHPPDILIATPGRLADHLRRGTLNLKQVSYFVMDEADKQLEMGFEKDIRFIMSQLPAKRQTVMASATFPEILEKLAGDIFTNEPVYVNAVKETVPAQIDCRYILCLPAEKPAKLENIIAKSNAGRLIIFCNTRERCREVFTRLEEQFPAIAMLHGEMEQEQRDKTMAIFRNGSIKILVATDLAARGIDVSTLELVINAELPPKESEYIHRIGRTGRAGKEGTVISLVTEREYQRLQGWAGIPPHKEGMSLSEKPMQAPVFQAKMATLHFHAGRKEKLSKGDIAGALIAVAGLAAADIGMIEVFDHYSYAAIPQKQLRAAMNLLNNGKIKGRKIKVSEVK